MKNKDYLLVALAPLPVLLIPLVGITIAPGDWKWTWSDFLLAWLVLGFTAFIYKLLATRKVANLAYRTGAGLAVAAGLFITWTSMAVQIIGDDNPGNLFYAGTILFGLVGVGVSRFQPAVLAKVAFTLASIVLLIPVVSVLFWPADFDPGFPKVFVLNSVFALMFTASGLLFRHAAGQSGGTTAATAA